MYVLQLDPNVPQAWNFCVSWPGYWAGMGFVEKAKDAVRFHKKKYAAAAMSGIWEGMNGCMKIRKLRRK